MRIKMPAVRIAQGKLIKLEILNVSTGFYLLALSNIYIY